MCGPILLINLGIFVADIILLGDMADAVGGLTTVLLTVVTAAIGISAVKDQGASALVRLQQAQMQQGDGPSVPPTREIIEGPLLALAGLYLLIPGFITDGLGALLLLPPVRRALAGWLADRMGRPPTSGPTVGGGSGGGDSSGGGGGPVIIVRPVERPARPETPDADRRLDEPRE